MDTTPEPSPVEEFVKRAERLASGAEHHIPSWLRPGDPESRLPVLFALVAVIGLQLAIPKSYTVVPRWPLIALELLLLAVLTWLNLSSKAEVNDLYQAWRATGAILLSAPESKPWGLHEFTAADPDGNLFRVFHDFATPERADIANPPNR